MLATMRDALPNFMMLTKYLFFSVLLISISAYAGQDHLCVDLNGTTTHATMPCNKMGMRDAESKDSSGMPYAKLQCPSLKKSITQLQAAIAKQDKLFKTPYSSVKQNALQQQLTSKQKQYQTQCES
tara:strand:+ start:117097 stop:117474 length:378 start_codon:yes stop_codon:yes gene_type:complete